jgi:ribosomal protein S6--L-glutamate ligase
MKIHFVLDEQVHAEAEPTYLVAMGMLADRGFAVSSGIPEAALLSPERLRARHDLYVLKSRSELALSIAGILHDRGGRFLNPYPACALAHNRIIAASRLAATGVPVPKCWVTADFARLCDLAAERPVVVKPYLAQGKCCGLLAHTPDDLAGIALGEHPVLVQEHVAGERLRVHVIGGHVGATSLGRNGAPDAVPVPVPLPAALRELALRCGRAFGLEVYGIDVVASADGPRVVEVDHAPAFHGVAGAAALLARHVEGTARAGTAPLAQAQAVAGSPAWAAGCLQAA